MKEYSKEKIKELEFEYNGTHYKFIYDELSYKNKYGFDETICEIPISCTKYANNEEIIKYVCQMALCIYSQGIEKGKDIKAREIRQVLGIKE